MTVLIGFLICHPVQVNWDPLLTGRKCGNPNIAFAVAGIMDVTTDFFVLLVPIPTVLKLNLPRASKVGLIFIFCMGILYVPGISSTPLFSRSNAYLLNT